MGKVLSQLPVPAVCFVAPWLLLSPLDLVHFFGVKHITQSTATTIGNQIWEVVKKSSDVIENDSLTSSLENIKQKICNNNPSIKIDRDSIKIHVVKSVEINAFALPNNHLIIYSGLIQDCKNAEELAGVMAHEIAHMTCKHIEKKMIKEVGIFVLLSTTGNTGTVIKELTKTLSSTAYDRTMESEANAYAVRYLQNTAIDPEHLANFLFRMNEGNTLPDAVYLISTHPNAGERADAIRQQKKEHIDIRPVMNQQQWQNLQKQVYF